jgi:iron-sulfur cluster assembly protein
MNDENTSVTTSTSEAADPLRGVRPTTASSQAIPGGAAKVPSIEVSPSAVEAVARQMKKRGTLDASLRLGIRGGGCSGFSYVIEFHDGPPHKRDRVFDHKASDGTPVRIVIDPKSLLYLDGTILEWEQTLMRQGFKFVNPNEKAGCGCGHSFSV